MKRPQTSSRSVAQTCARPILQATWSAERASTRFSNKKKTKKEKQHKPLAEQTEPPSFWGIDHKTAQQRQRGHSLQPFKQNLATVSFASCSLTNKSKGRRNFDCFGSTPFKRIRKELLLQKKNKNKTYFFHQRQNHIDVTVLCSQHKSRAVRKVLRKNEKKRGIDL